MLVHIFSAAAWPLARAILSAEAAVLFSIINKNLPALKSRVWRQLSNQVVVYHAAYRFVTYIE